MKKSFKVMLAVAMLFSATLSANAQFSKKENNRVPDRFHMGIRGGITSNTYTGDANGIDPLLFPTGGFAMDFQVAPVPIFLGFGLNYLNQGYKYDDYYDTETEDLHTVQVPITASYHINVAPNLFINPFAGGFVSYNIDSNFDKDVNYGLRFGCGMNFGRLTLDLGYDLGLANLGGDYYDAKSGTFFMTIGFNWAGSR